MTKYSLEDAPSLNPKKDHKVAQKEKRFTGSIGIRTLHNVRHIAILEYVNTHRGLSQLRIVLIPGSSTRSDNHTTT